MCAMMLKRRVLKILNLHNFDDAILPILRGLRNRNTKLFPKPSLRYYHRDMSRGLILAIKNKIEIGEVEAHGHMVRIFLTQSQQLWYFWKWGTMCTVVSSSFFWLNLYVLTFSEVLSSYPFLYIFFFFIFTTQQFTIDILCIAREWCTLV